MPKLTIAVDGPGSAGKGTVARGLARELGYAYVDTGAMYRSVALFAQRADIDWSDESACAALAAGLKFDFGWNGDALRVVVDDIDVTKDIRRAGIGRGASDVSKLPAVRAALLDLQRALGEAGGVVMDGRDIGTVVFPDADLKVYLDASLKERARRRHEELVRRGDAPTLEWVEQDLAARDKQDMERDIAPLKLADDGIRVDTTELTIPQAIDRLLSLARQKGA